MYDGLYHLSMVMTGGWFIIALPTWKKTQAKESPQWYLFTSCSWLQSKRHVPKLDRLASLGRPVVMTCGVSGWGIRNCLSNRKGNANTLIYAILYGISFSMFFIYLKHRFGQFDRLCWIDLCQQSMGIDSQGSSSCNKKNQGTPLGW